MEIVGTSSSHKNWNLNFKVNDMNTQTNFKIQYLFILNSLLKTWSDTLNLIYWKTEYPITTKISNRPNKGYSDRLLPTTTFNNCGRRCKLPLMVDFGSPRPFHLEDVMVGGACSLHCLVP